MRMRNTLAALSAVGLMALFGPTSAPAQTGTTSGSSAQMMPPAGGMMGGQHMQSMQGMMAHMKQLHAQMRKPAEPVGRNSEAYSAV